MLSNLPLRTAQTWVISQLYQYNPFLSVGSESEDNLSLVNMKPTLVADEMFPEGAGPYMELEELAFAIATPAKGRTEAEKSHPLRQGQQRRQSSNSEAEEEMGKIFQYPLREPAPPDFIHTSETGTYGRKALLHHGGKKSWSSSNSSSAEEEPELLHQFPLRAGGSSALLLDLATNEKAVHADFFNEFDDLYDDEELE